MVAAPDCDFCRKFATSESAKSWYDAELISVADFVVVPALGALTVGNVLAVTRQHHLSMRSVPHQTLHRILRATRDIRHLLSGAKIVIFEHGAGSGGGGGCVEHAHLQIAPLPVDVRLDSLLRGLRFNRFDSIVDALQSVPLATDYLLIEDEHEEGYVVTAPSVSRQHVRRLLAASIGAAEEWDYVAFPRYDIVQATIDRFKTLQIQVSDQ